MYIETATSPLALHQTMHAMQQQKRKTWRGHAQSLTAVGNMAEGKKTRSPPALPLRGRSPQRPRASHQAWARLRNSHAERGVELGGGKPLAAQWPERGGTQRRDPCAVEVWLAELSGHWSRRIRSVRGWACGAERQGEARSWQLPHWAHPWDLGKRYDSVPAEGAGYWSRRRRRDGGCAVGGTQVESTSGAELMITTCDVRIILRSVCYSV